MIRKTEGHRKVDEEDDETINTIKNSTLEYSITLIFSLILVYVIYGAELNLSILLLIFLHILFVLLAAIFKISYVARLTALKQLGKGG
jgi:ABC-type transport system involved in Fe-S cluster assembly fused permease/ATPase subunit